LQHKRQPPLAIVTIHDACPAFSKKIFTFTDELENLGIDYNIALIPFFKEKQDLPSFPNFVDRIKNCKGEIALHGLYHENIRRQLDDFHTRSRAIAEVEIRAGVEIFQEIGINSIVFVPPAWRLNLYSIDVLQKIRFKLSETQEEFILLYPGKFKKNKVRKVLSWDSSALPRKNIVNINRNKRHFKLLLQDKADLIRIALHPRDHIHALKDQKKMIIQLKDQGYKILKYKDLIAKL
jgi:predicted deacetylase